MRWNERLTTDDLLERRDTQTEARDVVHHEENDHRHSEGVYEGLLISS